MDDCIKVDTSNGRCNYRPAEMTDKTVYTLARYYLTVEEIAEHFSVSAETVLKHHGDAFRKGKLNHMMKPRMIMDQFFEEVLARPNLLGPEIIDLGDGKKVVRNLDLHAIKGMLELHAKKYEKMGKDESSAVEERPSMSDVKFDPL